MKKVKLVGQLDGDKVIVTDKSGIDNLIQKDFGELYDNYIVLDAYETIYLVEKRNMCVMYRKEELPKNAIIQKILENTDKDFLMHKYNVYKEFRDKGYVIKTGLKFGFDFRIYPQGKKIDEAHTKYVIEVWPQDKEIKSELIARSIRMALGLHATFILAIVDNELEISYYEMNRAKI